MFGSKNWSKLSPSLKLPEEVGITRLLQPVRIDLFLSTYFVHLLFQIETRSASFSCTSKRHFFDVFSCVHINQSIHLWTLNFFTLELKIYGLGCFFRAKFCMSRDNHSRFLTFIFYLHTCSSSRNPWFDYNC